MTYKGITITTHESLGGCREYRAEAPEGQRFAAVGVHEVIAVYSIGCKTSRAEAKAAIREDIDGGFEKCPDRPECDWCDGDWWVKEVSSQ